MAARNINGSNIVWTDGLMATGSDVFQGWGPQLPTYNLSEDFENPFPTWDFLQGTFNENLDIGPEPYSSFDYSGTTFGESSNLGDDFHQPQVQVEGHPATVDLNAGMRISLPSATIFGMSPALLQTTRTASAPPPEEQSRGNNHNAGNRKPRTKCTWAGCNKDFSRPSDARRHMNIHVKARVFPCDLCPETFSQQSNLVQHKNSKHHCIMKRCVVCGQEFRHASQLSTHKRKHRNT